MGKFRAGIKTSNQQTSKPVPVLTDTDMAMVNAGGFKVPKVVRDHWHTQSVLNAEKIAPLLKEFLIERYGLPDGVELADLNLKP